MWYDAVMTIFIPDSDDRPLSAIYAAHGTLVGAAKQSLAVTVTKTEQDGTQQVVAEYIRNSDSWHAFEPFRQFLNGVWHHYALVSINPFKVAVLDLSTGKIIAEEGTVHIPSADQKLLPADLATKIYSFAPVAFHVPDFFADHDLYYYDRIANGEHPHENEDPEAYRARVGWHHAYDYFTLSQVFPKKYSGTFGVFAGSIGFDDATWKVRYVDLSRIREGIVTTDERFGYVEFAGEARDFRHSIEVTCNPELEISLPVKITFNVATGGAAPHMRNNIHWGDESQEA